VRMKLGLRGDVVLNAMPEFEDCRALAEAAHVAIKDVQAAALAAFKK
jgi:pyridinium-3,5-bisthiocarboxylic acid mononucleotide nickel chelatase